MPRKKKTEAAISGEVMPETDTALPEGATEFNPEELEQQAAAVQESNGHTPGLRTTLTQILSNGKRLQVVDDGNRGGLGIKFDGLAEDEIPSAAVREILKAGESRDRRTAKLNYRSDMDKQWRGGVDYQEPGATRDTVQRKVEAIVELDRQGQAFEKRPPKDEGRSR